MTGTLLVTAALMGLAGTAHCAGMCSAACGGLARACVPAQPARGVSALLFGRAVAYVAAGVAVALVVQGLRWMIDGSAWLKPFWTLAQVLLIGIGLWLCIRGELPPSLQQWAQRLGRPRPARVHRIHLPGELKAGAAGLLWPLLPCGLLHAALGLAALSSGPVEAGAVMAAFALTSAPGLVAGGWLWRRIGGPGATASGGTWAIRLAGAGIALLMLWPFVRGVWAPIQSAWCG